MREFPRVVEDYLADLRRIRASGGATGERSGYGPLANLLNEIGGGLRPKVFCVGELADQGAGHPDFGLYAATQVRRGGGSTRPLRQAQDRPAGDGGPAHHERGSGAQRTGGGLPRTGGELPEHGVVEVKSAEDDAWLTAERAQVSKYWGRYRLVLVTNYRDFLLVGEDANGKPARLESFRLAADAADFERQLETPRAFAGRVGVGLGEYLRRVLSHRARLAEPRDLAELLASHARDALARVEAAEAESGDGAPPGDLGITQGWLPGRPSPQPSPRGRGSKSGRAIEDDGRYAEVSQERGKTGGPSNRLTPDTGAFPRGGSKSGRAFEDAGDMPRSPLGAVREALEEALGVQFEGERGARFFRSTLVQTLFYGVFSAWVLWARQSPLPTGVFDWRTAVWHLRAPVLRALFQQLSDPGRLQPLGLVEVLDWTAAALNRVEREAFFARFSEGQAVPYFYEPFLQAFDPALRKQLGVWYTPPAVVRYMVARVDRALKDDLGIAEGLAAENVYVLDPCCGTGAYLAETLRRIAANLHGQGLGALTGARVKRAAMERVFGFEIMPAPFVVAHLQVGLTMQALDAPLAEDETERAGIFLTNALTGWEPHAQKPLPFPELEEERDRAERVKRDAPILVILGNPPYNGFAGMAVDEERELSTAYRTTRRVRRPEGQGLNDLYVRFFRMAERRIAEKTGQGVVCFISNYSWLDSLSCPGMRERYLEAFDAIRIDNLNGDKYRTGKVAPDGSPDPSIFSTADDPVGIQVGTAIATLVRKADHGTAPNVEFRNLWGQTKLDALRDTAEAEPAALYDAIDPVRPLGLPFAPVAVSPEWFEWPALPELFPTSFPGVKTSRDAFLVDSDLDRLRERVSDYFDPDVSHAEIARRYPGVMRSTQTFNARAIRSQLLERGDPTAGGFVRYVYRPFDARWLYWEPDSGLLDRPRPEYQPHVFTGNLWLESREREAQDDFSRGTVTRHLADNFGNGLSSFFPAWLSEETLGTDASNSRRPNLSAAARHYLKRLGLGVEDLFHHVLAVLHDPVYRQANAGALRMEWPRIPLPHWSELSARTGTGENDVAAKVEEASKTLADSVARGRELAALLDPETPVPGVTSGELRPEIAAIAVPATTHGRNMFGDDFGLTAGWGHFGSGQAVMPGQGRVEDRAYTGSERAVLNSLADSWVTRGRLPGRPSPQPSPSGRGSKSSRSLADERRFAKVSTGRGRKSGRTFGDAGLCAKGSLGETTYDIYLNENAYWRNVPANVWNYRLGGYQVLKKWLSYRERKVLGRALRVDEVGYFSEVARRIGAILLVTNGE